MIVTFKSAIKEQAFNCNNSSDNNANESDINDNFYSDVDESGFCLLL